MTMEDAVTKRRTEGSAGRPPAPAAASANPRVWDPFVRVFHWLLVAGFVANYFELVKSGKDVHQVIGYVVLGLIAARLVWGLIGPRHARFSDFVRAPDHILRHLRQLARHRDQRYLGHNPAGGAMVVALLGITLLVGTSGWLSRTDWFFGVKWMEEAHEILANAMLALILLHVLGVVHACWRHRENLLLSMMTGRKRRLAPIVPPAVGFPAAKTLGAEPPSNYAPADRRG